MLDGRVDLKGAKKPYNFFNIECGPTTAAPGMSVHVIKLFLNIKYKR